MIQVFTKEWEITKNYIFDVTSKASVINLDWHDFEHRAQAGRPVVAVKVDEPLAFSELMSEGIGLAKQHIRGTLSSLMIVAASKPGEDLMMEELGGVGAILNEFADEGVDIVWGLLETEDIEHNHCVTVFAFEK